MDFEAGIAVGCSKERSSFMALPVRVSRGVTVDPFDAVHREFDGVLSRLFGGESNGGRSWSPYAVDVREDGDHIYVDADLPGFKKEEIDITLENQTLTISAEQKVEKNEEKKGEYLLNERRYNRFHRSFTLPPTVDEKHVDAKLNDGLLSITLNKREETKPRKIAVA
jgi:HSP20 family protein